MKVLFISGFLGSQYDLKSLVLKENENHFVNVQELMEETSSFEEAVNFIIQTYGKNFDLLVGYSFGGRLAGHFDESFARKKIFISSWVLSLSLEQKEVKKQFAQTWLNRFKEDFQESKQEWNNLPLFRGHSFKDYRAKFKVDQQNWSFHEVEKYFSHFLVSSKQALFSTQDLYIFGDQDEKYKTQALDLVNKIRIKNIEGAGHRCCYENPERVKELIYESN